MKSATMSFALALALVAKFFNNFDNHLNFPALSWVHAKWSGIGRGSMTCADTVYSDCPLVSTNCHFYSYAIFILSLLFISTIVLLVCSGLKTTDVCLFFGVVFMGGIYFFLLLFSLAYLRVISRRMLCISDPNSCEHHQTSHIKNGPVLRKVHS